ncbi:hypothetical protein CAC94_06900 [Salmonella enterica]|nr:hypothetical protein [Salmonella enterica]
MQIFREVNKLADSLPQIRRDYPQYRHVVSRVVKVLQDVFVSSNRQLRRPASPVGKVVVLTWRYF